MKFFAFLIVAAFALTVAAAAGMDKPSVNFCIELCLKKHRADFGFGGGSGGEGLSKSIWEKLLHLCFQLCAHDKN